MDKRRIEQENQGMTTVRTQWTSNGWAIAHNAYTECKNRWGWVYAPATKYICNDIRSNLNGLKSMLSYTEALAAPVSRYFHLYFVRRRCHRRQVKDWSCFAMKMCVFFSVFRWIRKLRSTVSLKWKTNKRVRRYWSGRLLSCIHVVFSFHCTAICARILCDTLKTRWSEDD